MCEILLVKYFRIIDLGCTGVIISAANDAEESGAVALEVSYLLVRPYRFPEQGRQVLAQFLIILAQHFLVFILVWRD